MIEFSIAYDESNADLNVNVMKAKVNKVNLWLRLEPCQHN